MKVRRLQPLISWVLVAAFGVSSLGYLPSPAAVARAFGGELTERFPCDGGHCGCYSAERCWNSCCCLSPDQQLAWATRNGVTPPPAVAKRLARLARADDIVTAHACCSAEKASGSSPAAADPCATADATDDVPPGAASPLDCQGVPSWLVVLMPIPRVDNQTCFIWLPALVGRVPETPSDAPLSRTLAVPAPPPRA